MEAIVRVADTLKSIRVRRPFFLWRFVLNRLQESRFSGLRPLTEFFDYHRISRPADLNQATSVSDSVFFGRAIRGGGGVWFPLPSALLEEKCTKSMVLPLLAHSGYHIILAISPVCAVFSRLVVGKKILMLLVLGNYGLIVAVLAVYAVYVAFRKELIVKLT